MNNENKGKKSKTIKLIVVLLFLAMLFIIYGVYLKTDTHESKEKKVITYLENKYNQEFEIIELVASKQYEEPPIGCDGSTFIPARKVKDKYQYDYEVLSKTDNVKFNVYYLDDKGEDGFKDSYTECKNLIETIDEISSHIIANIGDENCQKEILVEERDYTLTYDCDINIYLNENLDEKLDKNYISRLQSIRLYTNSVIDSFDYINSRIYNYNSYSHMVFNVYIHYQDGKYTKANQASTLYIYNENSKSGIDINSYWRNLNG